MPAPVKDVPINVKDRVKKNVEEGRGVSFFGGSGDFQFASSNPLWRASLEKLNFIPIANASYSGGVIITDWYDDGVKSESVKISIHFIWQNI